MRVRTTCEVCGNSKVINEVTISDVHHLRQCGACDFVYLGAVPEYEAVATEFAWEKTSLAEDARRRQSWWGKVERATRWRTKIGHLFDLLHRRKAIAPGGKALDIGCGGSCRVPAGPTPYGIELSPVLAKAAQRSFSGRGGYVVNASAMDGLDQFEDGFFDTILMRSYLEHEHAAFLVLEKAARKLAPGGKVYVRVPNYGSLNRVVMGAKWCGYRFPDHVNYFTPRTLRHLAARAGFGFRRVNRWSLFDDNIIAELVR